MGASVSPGPSGSRPTATVVFARWVERQASNEGEGFEELLAAHPGFAAELRAIRADWEKLQALLDELGLTRSLGERLRKRYGSQADPGISLSAEGTGEKPADFSSDVLRRLAGRRGEIGRYQLRGEVASGGQGAILRVWDEDLRRHLAMKVLLGQAELARSGETPPLDSRTLGRFLEEAQVTGQLDHPGIVPVHELGLDSAGRVYFTMKLVQGRTLKEVFELAEEEREGWRRTRVLTVLLKVCEAVAYAHHKGVVHRDLKPANVMVGRFGEVFVMDWGLAKVLGRAETKDVRLAPQPTTASLRSERQDADSDPDSPLLTMDGDVVGTPAYMAPEQAQGKLDSIGPHTDVYALGAMLYHLLARQMPYCAPGVRVSNRTILAMVLQGSPAPLHTLQEDIPAELEAICEKAMARDPARRYRDTSALAEDLRAYIENRVVKAYRTGALIELRKWIERNQGLTAAVAAAFLILVAGAITSTVFAVDARQETRRADDKAEEANRLKDEAIVAEKHAAARADALWAIQELKEFRALDDELDYARGQNRPAQEWWLEKAHDLVDGRPGTHNSRRKPGLSDHQELLTEIRAHFLGTVAIALAASGVDRSFQDRMMSLIDVIRAGGEEESRRLLDAEVKSFERAFGEGAWQWVDGEKRWWKEQLSQLEEDLLELRDRIIVAEESVLSTRATKLWEEAISAVAASPEYGGLRLTPQLELLPLGPDPDSGLWEFAHLTTGEPAVRGRDGKLVLEPDTGIVFVLLPSGRVPVEDGCVPASLSEVLLDPFFLSKYEMTVQQWKRTSPGGFPEDDPLVPAHGVSWDECEAILERAGLFLRLPTEAQWEYGCRAGTTTPWWTGAEDSTLQGVANVDFDPKDNKIGGVVSVGRLAVNPFGLHDVHGNVWEWCRDQVSNAPVRPGDGGDEVGSPIGWRVYRGGSFAVEPADARSNLRGARPPDYRSDDLGLRLARSITP